MIQRQPVRDWVFQPRLPCSGISPLTEIPHYASVANPRTTGGARSETLRGTRPAILNDSASIYIVRLILRAHSLLNREQSLVIVPEIRQVRNLISRSLQGHHSWRTTAQGKLTSKPGVFRACQRSADKYILKVNTLTTEQQSPTCNSKMPYPTRIRRLLIPIFLIVLVLAATLGVVMHHHAGSSADGCMLCHLVIAPAATTASVCGLAPSAMRYLIQDACFISRCAANQKPPRAPPV